MSFSCLKCGKEPLYRCPTCGTTAHINKKTKEIVIHLPTPNIPKPKPFKLGPTFTFPSHFGCELAKPITEIDIKKLILVEAKK